MARTRMSWDWVKGYPIFVYTTFIDHSHFHVKVVKGEFGKQNAWGYSPRSKAWFEYECVEFASKDAVVGDALRRAKHYLADEPDPDAADTDDTEKGDLPWE